MTIEMGIRDVVDTSKSIKGHSFTVGWLLDSLRENDSTYIKLHGNRPVQNVEAYDVSGGKGFVSIVLRCIVTFVGSTAESYTTILKIPGFESFKEAQDKSEFDAEMMNDKTRLKFVEMHQLECDFYSKLAPIIQAPIPKVYKVEDWILDQKEGCLHMEDLTLRGKTITFFDNISLTQVKSYIKRLAKMHKNVLSCDPKLWKGKFTKAQEGFVDFMEFMGKAYEPFIMESKREKEIRPLLEKYIKFSESADFYLYVHKQSFKDQGLTPVLAQGDMHPGNVMWAVNEDGDIEQELAAIIDWQTMHEGSPMEDLARFLSHCADGVVRRQSETFAFKYYYQCLLAEFGGDSTKVPYTVDQLKKSYNMYFISQAFFSVAVFKYFFVAIEDKIPNQVIKAACHDYGIQKAFHCLEDADRIIQGDKEYKQLYEKYGL